jgi:hypothetical protein
VRGCLQLLRAVAGTTELGIHGRRTRVLLDDLLKKLCSRIAAISRFLTYVVEISFYMREVLSIVIKTLPIRSQVVMFSTNELSQRRDVSCRHHNRHQAQDMSWKLFKDSALDERVTINSTSPKPIRHDDIQDHATFMT